MTTQYFHENVKWGKAPWTTRFSLRFARIWRSLFDLGRSPNSSSFRLVVSIFLFAALAAPDISQAAKIFITNNGNVSLRIAVAANHGGFLASKWHYDGWWIVEPGQTHKVFESGLFTASNPVHHIGFAMTDKNGNFGPVYFDLPEGNAGVTEYTEWVFPVRNAEWDLKPASKEDMLKVRPGWVKMKFNYYLHPLADQTLDIYVRPDKNTLVKPLFKTAKSTSPRPKSKPTPNPTAKTFPKPIRVEKQYRVNRDGSMTMTITLVMAEQAKNGGKLIMSTALRRKMDTIARMLKSSSLQLASMATVSSATSKRVETDLRIAAVLEAHFHSIRQYEIPNPKRRGDTMSLEINPVIANELTGAPHTYILATEGLISTNGQQSADKRTATWKVRLDKNGKALGGQKMLASFRATWPSLMETGKLLSGKDVHRKSKDEPWVLDSGEKIGAENNNLVITEAEQLSRKVSPKEVDAILTKLNAIIAGRSFSEKNQQGEVRIKYHQTQPAVMLGETGILWIIGHEFPTGKKRIPTFEAVSLSHLEPARLKLQQVENSTDEPLLTIDCEGHAARLVPGKDGDLTAVVTPLKFPVGQKSDLKRVRDLLTQLKSCYEPVGAAASAVGESQDDTKKKGETSSNDDVSSEKKDGSSTGRVILAILILASGAVGLAFVLRRLSPSLWDSALQRVRSLYQR